MFVNSAYKKARFSMLRWCRDGEEWSHPGFLTLFALAGVSKCKTVAEFEADLRNRSDGGIWQDYCKCSTKQKLIIAREIGSVYGKEG